jgi:predicted nucleic acid-binding protein
MKRYLLDTGIMGDFINHRKGVDERAREARQSGAKIGTCLPVVAELFFGVEFSQTRDKNMKKLRRGPERDIVLAVHRGGRRGIWESGSGPAATW